MVSFFGDILRGRVCTPSGEEEVHEEERSNSKIF